MGHYRHVPGYYGDAYGKLVNVVDGCIRALRNSGIEHDTIVVTGISGMLVGPMLAAMTNKNIVIVPKPDDTHHHRSSNGPIGEIGNRWVFVDDLIATGTTHRRVQDAIKAADPNAIEVAYLEYFNKPGVTRLYPTD